MIPIDFPEKNRLFKYGPGMDLYAHDDGEYLTCCWQLNQDDLERINKNGGKLWLRILSRVQPPISMQVINPFAMPLGIQVPKSVVDDVHVLFFNDIELVTCTVKETYHSFRIEKTTGLYADNTEKVGYQLTVRDSGFGDQQFDTDFVFDEEVRLIGLVSEQYGSYDAVAEYFQKKPETLLLLERVNTTIQ